MRTHSENELMQSIIVNNYFRYLHQQFRNWFLHSISSFLTYCIEVLHYKQLKTTFKWFRLYYGTRSNSKDKCLSFPGLYNRKIIYHGKPRAIGCLFSNSSRQTVFSLHLWRTKSANKISPSWKLSSFPEWDCLSWSLHSFQSLVIFTSVFITSGTKNPDLNKENTLYHLPSAATWHEITYCLIFKVHMNVKIENNKKYTMSLQNLC